MAASDAQLYTPCFLTQYIQCIILLKTTIISQERPDVLPMMVSDCRSPKLPNGINNFFFSAPIESSGLFFIRPNTALTRFHARFSVMLYHFGQSCPFMRGSPKVIWNQITLFIFHVALTSFQEIKLWYYFQSLPMNGAECRLYSYHASVLSF